MKYNWHLKLLPLLWLNLIVIDGSCQNLWTVSNDPSFDADFDNIQEAIDSADTGDKIYVHGSSIVYDTTMVDKRLHLIGSGYWKAENSIPDENLDATTIGGSLHLLPGSDSSIVEGFNINSYIEIGSNNVIVRYNSICCDYSGWPGLPGYIIFSGIPLNATIYGNAVHATMKNPAISANIFNNIFLGADDERGWANNSGSSGCIVQNNVYSYNGCCEFNISQCTFRNNIVRKDQAAFSDCIVENNIFTDSNVRINGVETDSLGNGNIDGVDINTIWDLSDPSPDDKFQLIGDSTTNVAFGAGINGEDCGAFGGNSPYRLSGIVKVPTIYQMLIPLVGDTTNMLNIKIKAKSN